MLGALTYVFMLIGWQSVVVPRLPDEPFRMGLERKRFVWVSPGVGPMYPIGEPETAEILFLGDSRAQNAIVLDTFEDAGLGSAAIVWGAAAPIEPLVEYARELPASRIVACVSVLSLREQDALASRLILMERPPDPEDPPNELLAWRRRRVTALENEGIEPERYLPMLRGLMGLLEKERAGFVWTPRAIDSYLSRQVDEYRDRHLRVLHTARWDESWFFTVKLRGSDSSYARSLPKDSLKERHGHLDRTLRILTRLRAEGRDVICVRLPVDSGLLRIEEEHFPSRLFTRSCKLAGIPFLDYSRAPFTTRDGSHLTSPSAKALSRDLADKLVDPATWRN